MSQASTATITLGGVPAQHTFEPAPAPAAAPAPAPAPAPVPVPVSAPAPQSGSRRRRENVPDHMLHTEPQGVRRTATAQALRTRGRYGGGGGDGGMTFGTVYTTKSAAPQSSTPDQIYQTQTLFKDRPQQRAQPVTEYQPGPHENIDSDRAAEARAKIQQMGISPEQVEIYRRRFNTLDLNNDGVVNLREFAAISRVLGYKFSKVEVLEIFGRKDLDDSGGISFDEFVIAMYERAQKVKVLAPYRAKFRLFDWKDRGYITTDEAFPILKKELGFDENKTEMMIDKFDRNKDYRLSLLEFIEFYKKVEELKIQVHNAFRDFDRNGDGFVDANEVKAVLGPKGFSDQQIQALMYKFDKDADGMLNYQEFAAFWDVQFV